jgi:serine/threonine-protein phosphatase 2A regulatory subunit B'
MNQTTKKGFRSQSTSLNKSKSLASSDEVNISIPIVVPKSDLNIATPMQKSNASSYCLQRIDSIKFLPSLFGVSDELFNERLTEKLRQCTIICNFADPFDDLKFKQIKTDSLQEILHHIS